MNRIEETRITYLPKIVRYVLIAESPPKDPCRFFYYPDVKQHDHLFLAVMKALYPEKLKCYLDSGRITKMKVDLLQKFMAEGFFLMDLFDNPSSVSVTPIDQAIRKLMESLKQIASPQTPVILIKASVYDILAKTLKKFGSVNLIPVRIPFPLYQWKSKFDRQFLKALAEAGYFSRSNAGANTPNS